MVSFSPALQTESKTGLAEELFAEPLARQEFLGWFEENGYIRRDEEDLIFNLEMFRGRNGLGRELKSGGLHDVSKNNNWGKRRSELRI